MAISVAQTIGRRFRIRWRRRRRLVSRIRWRVIRDAARSATGFFDINCNPVTLNDVRYLVDPSIRTNIAGTQHVARARVINTFDMSLQRSFKLPFTPLEQDRFEIRFDYFNVFNTPIFRFELGGLADGDVLNPNFNQVRSEFGRVGWRERRTFGTVAIAVRLLERAATLIPDILRDDQRRSRPAPFFRPL